MSFEDDILIERFLKGELTLDEKDGFNQRLDTDSEFREKVQLEKQLLEALNEDSWSSIKNLDNRQELEEYQELFKSDNIQELKKTIAEIGYKNELENRINPKRNWYFYSAVAALLVVSLMVYVNVNQTPSLENLYTDYLDSTELPSLVTRDNTNVSINNAEALFTNENYDEAIVAYTDLIEKMPSNKGTLYLYKGVSQMKLNKFADAEKTFDKLMTSESLDATKAYWYKALLYLKMKDRNQASDVLKVIIDNRYFNYKKAVVLLEDLK